MIPLSLSAFFIVCPLAFLAGFIDAIAGGGGLITLPAYMLSGLPVHAAIGTNKLGSCMGCCAATLKYARSGYIRPRLAVVCVAGALCGSTAGAELALRVPDGAFRVLMLFILPVAAWYVLKKRELGGGRPFAALPQRKTLLLSVLIALGTGVYDGFYGPGAGTFMLLLTGAAGLDLNTAAGTTKVINLSTNIAALTVYLINGKVLYPLGLAAGAFSIAGNWLGASSFTKKGTRLIRPVILTVLVIFFVKLLTEIF